MTKMIRILMVTVPEDVKTYGLGVAAMYKGAPYLVFNTPKSFDDERIYLPPGNYSIVGLASELSEEQKENIVEKDYLERDGEKHEIFMNYRVGVFMYGYPEGSFDSLLKHHSLDPKTTLILKQINE